MSYQIFTPPASLKKYVKYVWALENKTGDTSLKTFTVMSSGEPGIVFQERPEVFIGFERERLPQLFVFGQATGYGQLHSSGNFRTMGVSLQPTALRSLFGLDASELTDKNICITQLAKTSLTDQLLNCNTVQQRAHCFFTFLEARIKHYEYSNNKLEYAASALQQGMRLPDVLHQLNISERTLQRLFTAYTGITPILYARICRFQSSLAVLRGGTFRSLTDVAHAQGYFDQSHFIRDFKLFAGVNPGIYLRKAMEHMPGFPEWQ